jgi:hypothetical protein
MRQPALVVSLLDLDDAPIDHETIVGKLKQRSTRAFAPEREERSCSPQISPGAPAPHQKLR